MRNAGLEETQAGIKIAGRNINNLRYADDTTLRAESEEELKSFLMKVKEKNEFMRTLPPCAQGPKRSCLSPRSLFKSVPLLPGVMYGCESWTIKKAEPRRIDGLELWCWTRLESPLDCKKIKPVNPKGNQS